MNPDQRASVPTELLLTILAWVFWASMTTGVLLMRLFLGTSSTEPLANISYIALGPLFVSAVIRFVLLPRMKSRLRAFPVFVVGMAMAESCALIGIFLGGARSDMFVGMGLGMLLSYAPILIPKPRS